MFIFIYGLSKIIRHYVLPHVSGSDTNMIDRLQHLFSVNSVSINKSTSYSNKIKYVSDKSLSLLSHVLQRLLLYCIFMHCIATMVSIRTVKEIHLRTQCYVWTLRNSITCHLLWKTKSTLWNHTSSSLQLCNYSASTFMNYIVNIC